AMYTSVRFTGREIGRRVRAAIAIAVVALLAGSISSAQSGPTCPCSIWASSSAPAVANSSDTRSIELGVKFRADVNGFITALRFYKGPLNTGTHTGSLWTSSGTLLTRVTFTGETASGWQQVTLPTPVAITANTVYVASYFAPAGRYSVTQNAFTSAGVDTPPLHALANTVSPNGVFRAGTTSGFPTNSSQATNYWVDVVFATTSSDAAAPTVTTVSPANAATG